MKNYHPEEVEKKWREAWEKEGSFKVGEKSKKEKYYCLVEFPYPSSEGLHLGHTFTMTLMDVLARKKRMEGKNVLHPMGWDAFGLPTENHAIKTGVHPAIVTKKNTDRFKSQMKAMGLSYNWDREVNTTDPSYYKWTQWIFIQLFKYGLAYKKETPVGWCPSCKTVLANEEIVSGNCERCGHEAEHKMQKQWLLEITKYADRLADDLEEVDYPDYIKTSQRNWIGATEGIEIEYPVKGKDFSLSCYSTRPDTNFGATFVVIAPEHALVEKLVTEERENEVLDYIEKAKKKSEFERVELEKEKTGVFTGSYCLNRLTNKKMPIWVSDFVVLSAGTGVVVGVPAHDQRDWEFAKKHKIDIVPVIKPREGEWDFEKSPFIDIDDAIVFNSDFLNEMPALKAKTEIIDYLVEKGWGKKTKNYHLRDWIFSRQHYWGEPFPMVYCKSCAQKGISWWNTEKGKDFLKKEKLIGSASSRQMEGWFPVEEDDLPVKLAKVEKYEPTSSGESPLANMKDWLEVKCPHCGGSARRETDTMPNWAGSSWYYLRFTDPENDKCFADREKMNYFMPVDIYLGGAEHTTLHLLYSRFWYKFLFDLGLVPGKEPYASRRQHGVILGEDGFRMSKSRGNGVNPDNVIEKFGADTLRLYLMFMGPYDAVMPWSDQGLEGSWKFLNRVLKFANQAEDKALDKREERQVNKTIKKVGKDIVNLKYNTAIASLMEMVNEISKAESEGKPVKTKMIKVLCLLLAPFAPFMAEEIWREVLKNPGSVHKEAWPEFDESLVKEEKTTLIIQVNGKMRGQLEVLVEDSKNQEKIEALAKKDENTNKFLKGRDIKKTIFVAGKIINFVV